MNKLDVVFRVFSRKQGGQVIALFCNSAHECRPGNVMSYMHTGQHGEASRYLGQRLRLAKPSEYAPLLRELQTIYHDHEVNSVSRLRA